MNLPTDTDLEKRAQEITENIFLGHDFRSTGRINDIKWMEGHESATLEALKIDRESYNLLKLNNDILKGVLPHALVIANNESHLTTLRTRLGITE